MDQAVVGLAAKVPEDRLTLGPVHAALAESTKRPEPLPVGRALLLKFVVDHSMAKRRLAHAVITD
jgi:hypothetical protein